MCRFTGGWSVTEIFSGLASHGGGCYKSCWDNKGHFKRAKVAELIKKIPLFPRLDSLPTMTRTWVLQLISITQFYLYVCVCAYIYSFSFQWCCTPHITRSHYFQIRFVYVRCTFSFLKNRNYKWKKTITKLRAAKLSLHFLLFYNKMLSIMFQILSWDPSLWSCRCFFIILSIRKELRAKLFDTLVILKS